MRPSGFSRRMLLQGAGAALVSAGAGIGATLAAATGPDPARARGYGRLRRDSAGILELPKGFTYRVISRVGDPMSDGLRVPGMPDGMHAFAGKSGRVRLLRNHELTPDWPETAFVGTGRWAAAG